MIRILRPLTFTLLGIQLAAVFLLGLFYAQTRTALAHANGAVQDMRVAIETDMPAVKVGR